MIEGQEINNADIEVKKKFLKRKKATAKNLFTKARQKFLEPLQ